VGGVFRLGSCASPASDDRECSDAPYDSRQNGFDWKAWNWITFFNGIQHRSP